MHAPAPSQPELVSGKRLATNVVWNLAGIGLPALLAIVTIPLLIEEMGAPRLGVLMLAWATVGYFSLFDMGFGRAMTQMIARQLGSHDRSSIPSLFWTGMALMALLGVLGAATLAALTPWLVGAVLEIPPELQQETRRGLYAVALGLPLVVSSSGLQGVVEAHQQFRTVFIVKIIQGTITFLGPLIAVQFTNDLSISIGTLLVGRLLSWLLLLSGCVRTVGRLGRGHFERHLVKPMATFGGWMTITNILGPILLYADRFLIGAMLSMSAVAYYATPSEIVVRFLILPNALLGVIFPLFAALAVADPDRMGRLFERSVRYVFLVMAPVALIGVGSAAFLLELWLGADFAAESHRVTQWLLVGILFNGVAHMPSGLIAAIGRPDVTAKLHLLEAPIYVVVLWFLVQSWGIEGAAIAWVLRVGADALVLMLLAGRLVQPVRKRIAGTIAIGILAAVVLVLLIVAPMHSTGQAFISLLLLMLFVPVGWLFLLDREERQNVLSYIKVRTRP